MPLVLIKRSEMEVRSADQRTCQPARVGTFGLFLLLFLCLAKLVAAQDTTRPLTQPQSPEDPAQNTPSSSQSGSKQEEQPAKTETKKEEEDKKVRRGAIVLAPLPIVSPAIGSGIVPVAGYIFPLEENKNAPEPSVVGAAGLITNNGTRGFGLGTETYLKDARYEIKAFYVRGNIDYNLYGVGYVNGSQGLKLPLEQTGSIFFVDFLRKIVWDTYVGVRFVDGDSFITLKPTSGEVPAIPPDVGLHTNLRALGFEVVRDSRPNRFYPVKGSLTDFTGDFFANGLGSKYSFQSYKFTFNKYFSLSEKQVLAYNLFFCGTGGAPPFYGQCIYGSNNELRGYTAGRYLDHYMLATQLEYRLVLLWRFGVVAFGGVGAVAPAGDQFRARQLLPAGGTGIRFLLSKKYHVNLRTDFAWGKDNFTWSMGVGEAF
jgi:Omp85 superfamily domain